MPPRFGEGRGAARKRFDATTPLLLVDAPGQYVAKPGIGFNYADGEFVECKFARISSYMLGSVIAAALN